MCVYMCVSVSIVAGTKPCLTISLLRRPGKNIVVEWDDREADARRVVVIFLLCMAWVRGQRDKTGCGGSWWENRIVLLLC